MERREFIKMTGAATAAVAFDSLTGLAQQAAGEDRTVLSMNRNWRYKAEKVEGAHQPSFNDAGFETVVVPHTNILLPWHSFDDKDYEFISTYRRRFRVPAGVAGKRVFVDFEGAMTASTVWINGAPLGEYKGGFTPFSFELTNHLHHDAENVLVVQLDSTERADIPPFGYEIDYMTFGGIYREVSLRVVSPTYIDNIHAHPKDVLTKQPSLDVDVFLAGQIANDLELAFELRDGERTISRGTTRARVTGAADPNAALDPDNGAPVYASTETTTDPARQTITLTNLGDIKLWDLEHPNLYTVHVTLLKGGRKIDGDSRRIGFREATFTDHGFSLNGKIIKLRGLDRHQTFPFVGQAMPARVQRKDAEVLRHGLHCNIVRTSHYPQSRHFLDHCDEIGLLVLEEIPGWQHIGDEAWKRVAIDNVGRMVRRDWNHPSIVLWGVRINESHDDHDFYTSTNALAHALDQTRQTGGIRNFPTSELLEDVMTINDFGFPLRKPNHPRYLNTEFVGHTYPTKTTDDDERQREHTLRHARIHNQLASDPQYAGGIGWCAFDYNTHANFGAGDRICYHGVTDIFRENKAAAGFYKSQCEPAEEIVLEPAFHWANSDESVSFSRMVVCSNCEHLRFYVRERSLESNPWVLLGEAEPDRQEFANLKFPPFVIEKRSLDWKKLSFPWGDLKIEGMIGGKVVATRMMSGRGVDEKFTLIADDAELKADGADATRVVLRATDAWGNARTYANDPIVLQLEGPAQLIGDSPFALIGGTGAVWIRAKETPGAVTLKATHPRLGSAVVNVRVNSVAPEVV